MRYQLDIRHDNPLIQESSLSALKRLMAISGEIISQDPISQMKRVETDAGTYYVKVYTKAGKHLRQYIGRSRAQAEYDNMLLFESLGIPTAKVIAFGAFRERLHQRACIVTEAIPNVKSLLELKQSNASYLHSKSWVAAIMQQVAMHTARLHQQHFVHVDLKWRNILVEPEQQTVYFIDCPQGHQSTIRFKRGQVKDLACLDKVAKYTLSQTQRLSFYKQYIGAATLTPHHKQMVRKVTQFFEGRE